MIRRILRTSIALLVLPVAARAQSLDLRLTEEALGRPVAGAIVRLMAGASVVAQGLTNEAGRIVLRAPGAGTYQLKADRIGWNGLLTEPFALGADVTLRRELVMPGTRRELPTIMVRGRSRCDPGGQGGPLAAALWEEIRNALTANVLTQRQQAVPLHVRQFIREVSLGRSVLRQWTYRSTITRGNAFVSVAPAELAEIGFVYTVGDSVAYSAPDAALLLSDEFVGTHCFRVVRGDSGLVGLAFEPIPGRKVPEVNGTMWVDRGTSELRYLEYDYTGLPKLLERARLGGRVQFERLPVGAWIVSYWHIRMPTVDSTMVRGTGNTQQAVMRLVGFRDQGGRAEVSMNPLGAVDRAILIGAIHDSLTGKGLPDAVVRVDGTHDSVVTDGTGRFELAVRASGDQTVVVAHPKLGLLRDDPRRPVLLSLSDTTTVSFATPSIQTFVRAYCGPPRERAGVVGLAFGPDSIPAAGLDIRSRWLTANGWKQVQARSIPRGAFALCDLASGATLPIRLHQGNLALAEERLRLEPGEWRWIDLRASPVPLTFPEDATVRGQRVLAGVARDDSTGRPVAGVDVVLEGTDKTAVTNEIGRYAINDAPTGVRALLFRAIGYRPARLGLRLVEADTVWADARLVREGVVLDPIEVTARPPAPRGMREGFEERRSMGFGRYLDSTELRKNEHRPLDELLGRLQGVQISTIFVDNRLMRVATNSRRRNAEGYPCYMTVILNGMVMNRPGGPSEGIPDLRRDFTVASLESVEVYLSRAGVPIEYGGAGSDCGVVILWSRQH
jgi:hypothetical protein